MQDKFNEEIDIKKLFHDIFEFKLLAFSITAAVTIFGIALSLYLPNTYTSSTLLMSPSESESLSTKLGGYAQFANFAGVNIGEESASISDEAIARISSLEFFSKYFLPNINLEDIIAVKKWLEKENKIIYKKSIYNSDTGQWVRKVSFPKTKIPSEQEAYKIYKDILTISKDKKTSFVSISIEHKSPYIAKEWLEIIVNQINSSMKETDKSLAQQSINFLETYSTSTNIQSLQDAIANLLDSQLQTLMLTSADDSYVFKTINSPFAPEEKSSPNRLMIILLFLFTGIMLSIVLILFISSKRIKKL